MSEDNRETLLKELKELVDTLKIAPVTTAANNSAAVARPRGWANSTVASYYKESYAIELKVILDTALEEGKDFLLRHDRQVPAMTKRALEAKIAQAFHYIIDNMDDSEKNYQKLRARLEISLRHPDGVMLRWRAGIKSTLGTPLTGESINYTEEKWKEKIFKFVDTAQEGQTLVIHNAGLSTEEFEWLLEYLKDLSDIFLHPKSDVGYIKLIKSKILKEI